MRPGRLLRRYEAWQRARTWLDQAEQNRLSERELTDLAWKVLNAGDEWLIWAATEERRLRQLRMREAAMAGQIAPGLR